MTVQQAQQVIDLQREIESLENELRMYKSHENKKFKYIDNNFQGHLPDEVEKAIDETVTIFYETAIKVKKEKFMSIKIEGL